MPKPKYETWFMEGEKKSHLFTLFCGIFIAASKENLKFNAKFAIILFKKSKV